MVCKKGEMSKLVRCHHSTGNYYHFSSRVFVPEIKMSQLRVKPRFLNTLLNDIWCIKNSTAWECPLLPDWTDKINFVCDNSSCIEYCSLHVDANLQHYLIYVGCYIIVCSLIVFTIENYNLKLLKKNY